MRRLGTERQEGDGRIRSQSSFFLQKAALGFLVALC